MNFTDIDNDKHCEVCGKDIDMSHDNVYYRFSERRIHMDYYLCEQCAENFTVEDWIDWANGSVMEL